MTFNRAKKTEPRVLRLSGERHADMTSVADLFCFGTKTSPWKPGSRAGLATTLLEASSAEHGLKDPRLNWHQTLGQMRDMMSKAEKLDPSSLAAEEFMCHFRQIEGNGHLDSNLASMEKARQRGDRGLEEPHVVAEANRPGTVLGAGSGNLRALRRSQSHGTVGRLLTGPELWPQRRKDLQVSPKRSALGSRGSEDHLRDSPKPEQRLLRSQTDNLEAETRMSRAASLPRLSRRQTCGF